MGSVKRRVTISGRVQGVYFRQSARLQARELGLVGWVRNRLDGRVEAVFQGPPEAVEAMLRWCRQGPPGAYVSTVDVQDEAPDLALDDFSILRTI